MRYCEWEHLYVVEVNVSNAIQYYILFDDHNEMNDYILENLSEEYNNGQVYLSEVRIENGIEIPLGESLSYDEYKFYTDQDYREE